MKRLFKAAMRTGSRGFNLACSRCGTVEELAEDEFPHDAAVIHSRWWHRGPIRIPVGWQK